MWCTYRLAKSYGWCSVCGCSHDLLSVCPIFLVYLWDELKCARNRSRYPSCGNNKYATVKYHRTVVNSCFLCHVYTFAVIVLNQAVTSSMVAPNVIVMGCHFWNAFIPTYIFNNAMKMIWHYQHFPAPFNNIALFFCPNKFKRFRRQWPQETIQRERSLTYVNACFLCYFLCCIYEPCRP